MNIDDIIKQYEQLHKDHDFFQFRWHTKDETVTAEFWDRVSDAIELSQSVQYNY